MGERGTNYDQQECETNSRGNTDTSWGRMREYENERVRLRTLDVK